MRTLLSTVAVVALAVAGCGGDADMAGTVTYKGKPVVYGTVVVVGADGIPKSGTIQPDGTYRVSGVKAGPAKVAVSSPRPSASAPADDRKGRDRDSERVVPAPIPVDPEIVKNWFALPEKYGDPAKSELNYLLQGGSNAVNIDLK
ncbi:MAG TPA: hypothetical protein VFG68_16980 [Fimbriiglobus sp.]|nr:hypothetical protein [Fimbriiglobus sp.]